MSRNEVIWCCVVSFFVGIMIIEAIDAESLSNARSVAARYHSSNHDLEYQQSVEIGRLREQLEHPQCPAVRSDLICTSGHLIVGMESGGIRAACIHMHEPGHDVLIDDPDDDLRVLRLQREP